MKQFRVLVQDFEGDRLEGYTTNALCENQVRLDLLCNLQANGRLDFDNDDEVQSHFVELIEAKNYREALNYLCKKGVGNLDTVRIKEVEMAEEAIYSTNFCKTCCRFINIIDGHGDIAITCPDCKSKTIYLDSKV